MTSEYLKSKAVMEAADCGDEEAADFLRYLDDRGYGVIDFGSVVSDEPDTTDYVAGALEEIEAGVETEIFLTKLHLNNFDVGEV